MLGDLAIDYTERRVTLADRPVHLVAMEYRMLAELSVSAGRVLTYEHPPEPGVCGREAAATCGPCAPSWRKLGNDAGNPAYIFTEPRIGYRMLKGETQEEDG